MLEHGPPPSDAILGINFKYAKSNSLLVRTEVQIVAADRNAKLAVSEITEQQVNSELVVLQGEPLLEM